MKFDSRHGCVVIDNALSNPEALVQYALTHRESFRPVDFNAFPGTYMAPPKEFVDDIGRFFARSVRRHFDARRVLGTHCRLSMVTVPPDQLRPHQWICHRDGAIADTKHSIQASMLYLFKDESLGGTSFYESTRSAVETESLFADATRLEAAEFSHRYGIEPGYMTEGSAYFRHVGRIPAKWNRLIFYDGNVLHSGDIVAPERLSSDPRQGRLTVNGFFTSRRNAA